MSYLKFIQNYEDNIGIMNDKSEYLGSLQYIRVGAWMSWVLTDINSEDIYFSASCLDEIRAKQKELNAQKKGASAPKR